MSKKRDLHEAADDAVKVTRFDRALSGGLDVISFLPGGPVITSFLRQVVPTDHLIYLGTCLHEVAERIQRMEEEKVDRDYMASEGYRGDLERTFEALGFRQHREKQRHYVAALANAATVDRPKDAIRLRYWNILESVRLSHLALLAVVATAERVPLEGSVDEYLTARLVDQDLENVKLDWADLERAGVLDGRPTGMAMTPSTSATRRHCARLVDGSRTSLRSCRRTNRPRSARADWRLRRDRRAGTGAGVTSA